MVHSRTLRWLCSVVVDCPSQVSQRRRVPAEQACHVSAVLGPFLRLSPVIASRGDEGEQVGTGLSA